MLTNKSPSFSFRISNSLFSHILVYLTVWFQYIGTFLNFFQLRMVWDVI